MRPPSKRRCCFFTALRTTAVPAIIRCSFTVQSLILAVYPESLPSRGKVMNFAEAAVLRIGSGESMKW